MTLEFAGAATPSRLTVYDAPLDGESITSQMRENLDDELTEVKSENAVDRITSAAYASACDGGDPDRSGGTTPAQRARRVRPR